MKDPRKFKLLCLTTLAAIADCGQEGMPASLLSIACQEKIPGFGHRDLILLMETLDGAGWTTSKNHTIVATESGMELGLKVGKALMEATAS